MLPLRFLPSVSAVEAKPGFHEEISENAGRLSFSSWCVDCPELHTAHAVQVMRSCCRVWDP